MESHSNQPKRASTHSDNTAASLTHVRSTHTILSEPEDSMSSDVESFDEDDMYPANYNDETVSDSSDMGGESGGIVSNSSDLDRESQSPLEGMVCVSFTV